MNKLMATIFTLGLMSTALADSVDLYRLPVNSKIKFSEVQEIGAYEGHKTLKEIHTVSESRSRNGSSCNMILSVDRKRDASFGETLIFSKLKVGKRDEKRERLEFDLGKYVKLVLWKSEACKMFSEINYSEILEDVVQIDVAPAINLDEF